MFKKLAIIALLASFMFAGDAFTYKITTAYTADGKKLGEVSPLTKLKVVGKSGNKTKVELISWGSYGFTNVIFRNYSQRQRFALFDEKLTKKVQKILKTEKDEYGGTWQQVRNTFYVKSSDLQTNTDKLNKATSDKYKARCSVCHPMHEPHEHTVNQWPGIIKMMAPRAGLNKEERAIITAYLQSNAKDIKGN